MYSQRGPGAPSLAADSRAVVADRFAGGPGRRDRGFGHFPHTFQEEPQPGLPVSAVADVVEQLVVGARLLLKYRLRYRSGSRRSPASHSIRVISSRPRRPLPSRNGWMVSN